MNNNQINTCAAAAGTRQQTVPKIGVVEWFMLGDYHHVEDTIRSLKELGVTYLRTGISWADWYTQAGQQWYDWLLPRLAKEAELLPCFLYTPPSIGLVPKTSSPPRQTRDYADVLDVLIDRYGKYFEYIELWNEPNNKSEWDFTLDAGWTLFANMLGGAAYWARQRGKKTVLAGMSPVDPNWLEMIFGYGVMDYIDVVGFHGFPDVFDTHWEGWHTNIGRIAAVLERHGSRHCDIWITEAGFSTWQHDERKQLQEFCKVLQLPVERVYWYGIHDLNPEVNTVDGFHLDDREYFFGIKTIEGRPKLLYRLWANEGLEKLPHYLSLMENTPAESPARSHASRKQRPCLITGGLGFIGVNLAQRLLEAGQQVIVMDNLSQQGTEQNLQWLSRRYGDLLGVEVADVRNAFAVKKVLGKAGNIFHLAAQYSNALHPMSDFEVNVTGTLNVLEALRSLNKLPSLVFTSELNSTAGQVAREYVLYYAKTFRLPAVVLRLGEVYGPYQLINQQQGWLAYLLLRALNQQTIYMRGSSTQLRDLLFVEDVVEALCLAQHYMHVLAGEAFCIGAGRKHAVSHDQLLGWIGQNLGSCQVVYREHLLQQPCHLADYETFSRTTAWKPQVDYRQGMELLLQWVKSLTSCKDVPLLSH